MISGKTYQRYEYLVAVTISIGMFLFLFGSQETVGSKVRDGQVTTFSGFILLVGYLVSDAFTSNWKKNCLSRTKCPRYKLCVALTSFHACLHLCPFCSKTDSSNRWCSCRNSPSSHSIALSFLSVQLSGNYSFSTQ